MTFDKKTKQIYKRLIIQLWKESFNVKVKQFHQYQQNKQLYLNSNHWTQKRKKDICDGNLGRGLAQTTKALSYIYYQPIYINWYDAIDSMHSKTW